MLQSLFNNFTLLTTFIFFGHMAKSKFLECRKRTPYIRALLGTVLGLFGVVLMYYTFPISPYAVMDLRQLPILISVYLGGGIAGVICTAIIAFYRLFFLNGLGLNSLFGALDALVTLLIALALLRARKISFKRWFVALLLSALTTAVFLLILLKAHSWKHIGLYILLFILAGLFTFAMLRHLRTLDDSMRMMREAANRDFLTSLYNSRAFEVMMEQKIASAHRDRIPFTLLIVDIDYFKQVNDTYGHPAGDTVLLQFADVLRETFRPGDHIVRKGGEEFVVLVDQCDEEQILIISERLRSNVENHGFILPDGERLNLTISGGSATYPNIDEQELIAKADQALYRAKKAGRNRVYRAG